METGSWSKAGNFCTIYLARALGSDVRLQSFQPCDVAHCLGGPKRRRTGTPARRPRIRPETQKIKQYQAVAKCP